MFLFNYKDYKTELRNNDVTGDLIIELDRYSDAENLEDEPFYHEIIKRFLSDIKYKIPDEQENDFDYNLLLALIASSFSSSNYFFEFSYDNIDISVEPELIIKIQNEEKSVSKTISELWSFQIQRLFEIYIIELIQIFLLSKDDSKIMQEIDVKKIKFDLKIRKTSTIIKRRKLLIEMT